MKERVLLFLKMCLSPSTPLETRFIGRKRKGKTTFLLRRQSPQGSIEASVFFDYFPRIVVL